MTFSFEPMTPELRAWLACGPGTPPAERARLRAAVPPDLLTEWSRAQRRWRCRDATQAGAARIVPAPSGRFSLHITTHQESEPGWAYSRGRVYRGDELIAEIHRNYGAFPFAWVEDHPTGQPYLFAGEDYQGQTVLELDTGRRADHLPPEAAEGVGFCWAGFSASPSGRTMAVDGCYWACPYEGRLVDLSDPLTALPVLTYLADECTFTWQADQPDTCVVRRAVERYAPTGTRSDAMSDAEDDDLRRRQAAGEADLWQTEHVVETWTRGPLAEHLARQLADLEGGPSRPAREFINNIRILVARLPEAEQAGLLRRLAVWG